MDHRLACERLERLYSAVNAHDAETLASLCSHNVRWNDPAASQPLCGRQAVYLFHRDTMFRALPDVRIEIVDGPYLSLDGTRVAVRSRITGTMTGPLEPPGFAPTGRRVEFETGEFSHFDGELLADHTVVLDMLGLARQIGAVPEAGSRAERVGVWLQHVAAYRSRARG